MDDLLNDSINMEPHKFNFLAQATSNDMERNIKLMWNEKKAEKEALYKQDVKDILHTMKDFRWERDHITTYPNGSKWFGIKINARELNRALTNGKTQTVRMKNQSTQTDTTSISNSQISTQWTPPKNASPDLFSQSD